ncbi:MAG: hypothetical protein ABI645_10950, partial [Pseudomonadota bacterium]
MDEKHRHTRRSIMGNTLRLAGLTAAGAVSRAFAQQTSATRPPASQGQGAVAPNMTGTQVVLLGTKAGPGV